MRLARHEKEADLLGEEKSSDTSQNKANEFAYSVLLLWWPQ
jgi:hypothetical protein